MSGDFLDSNVFIYSFDEKSPEKRDRAQKLIAEALAGGSATISFQVVQETLKVITNKFDSPVTPEQARLYLVLTLLPLWTVMPSQNLYERALMIQGRYRLSFYDSLIVSAALEAGCDRLCSEDLQDGQRIESLTITNPFRE